MATAALKFAKDAKGDNTYAPLPTTTMYKAELTNGTADSITLASAADFYTVSFVFQPGTSCWVDVTGAVAVGPSTASFVTTTARLNPASYLLPAGAVISIVTESATAQVSVAIWQGGNS
tara:strand:- start:847 stop:1203 length:357 start_codon:yes stop_codon:yes gene_type:complete